MSTTFEIPINKIKAALLCAAKDDIRYYLNAVHFEWTPGKVLMVSTNGRLILVQVVIDPQIENTGEIMIDRNYLGLAKAKGTVLFNVEENSTRGGRMIHQVDGSAGKLSYKELAGKFPDWRTVLNSGDMTGLGAVPNVRIDPGYAVLADKALKLSENIRTGWPMFYLQRYNDELAAYAASASAVIKVMGVETEDHKAVGSPSNFIVAHCQRR